MGCRETVPPPRNPMRRIPSACCALAASGHAAAPPSSVMNLRRFMGSPPQAGSRTLPYRCARTLLCSAARLLVEWQRWGQSRPARPKQVVRPCPQCIQGQTCGAPAEYGGFFFSRGNADFPSGEPPPPHVHQNIPPPPPRVLPPPPPPLPLT